MRERERGIDKINEILLLLLFLRIEQQCNSTFEPLELHCSIIANFFCNSWSLQVPMLGLFGALMLKFSYI